MDIWRELGITLGTVLLVALCARLSLSIPGAEVPISLQTLAVGVIALGLSTQRGTVGLAAYVGLAAAGLPVLSDGASGINAVSGVSGGYLLGFVLAPVVVAGVRGDDSWPRRFVGVLLAHGVILGLGAAWIYVLKGTAPLKLFSAAVLPYVPGGVLKSALAVGLVALADRSSRS